MNMTRLTNTLIRHEGYRQFPYKDTVGKLTIAVGRNLDDVGINESEARMLLSNDIQHAIDDIRNRFFWFDSIDDIRQEVVINMVFNLGIKGFSKFKRTIGYIEQQDWSHAAAEMLSSKWADQVGERAHELARMMASGLPED